MFATKSNTERVAEGVCMTRMNKQINFTYKWFISNFRLIDNKRGEPLLSPIFSMGKRNEYKWQLKFYPRGDPNSCARIQLAEDVSVHLISLEPIDKADFTTKVKFTVFNTKLEVVREVGPQFHTFGKNNLELRHHDFIKRQTLINHIRSGGNDSPEEDKFVLMCDIAIVDGESTTQSTHSLLDINQVPENPSPDDDFSFGDLFSSAKLSDVTLIAACGREFRAHKAILGGRSAVFLAMFELEMKEQRENRVNIEDMDGVVLHEMLMFIYTGKSRNVDTLAEGLLAAADKYQLEGLKKLCTMELGERISVENAMNLLIIADLYHAVNFKTQVSRFISTHAKEVLETESFKSSNKTHPQLANEVLISAITKIDLSL